MNYDSQAQKCFIEGVHQELQDRFWGRQVIARRRGINVNTVKQPQPAYVDRVALRYWNLVLGMAFLAGAVKASDLVLRELNDEA